MHKKYQYMYKFYLEILCWFLDLLQVLAPVIFDDVEWLSM